MPYYRSVGEIPRKRHTQFRAPGRSALRRRADGRRGFLGRLRPALPPPPADRDRGRRGRRGHRAGGRLTVPNHPLKPRHFRTQDLKFGRATPTRSPAGGCCSATRTCAICFARRDRAEPALPQRGRRRAALRAGRHRRRSRRSTAPLDRRRRRLRGASRRRAPTAWCPTRPSRCGCYVLEAQRAHRPAEALPGGQGPVPGALAVLRARPARPRPSRCWSRARTSTCCAAPGGRHPLHLRQPPVRRGRLGRLPVPVGVQHRRLRADHRPGAPAAAGAPDVRGAELRGVLVLPAQGRLPPAVDPGALQPRERRLRRADVLRRRRLRGPQGLRASGIGSLSLHPSGFTHGPQPGAAEGSIGADYFDETAVMVDTFRPLELGEAAAACEDPRYAWSWARRGPDL